MILVAKQMYLFNILSLHIERTDLFCLSFCGQTTGHSSSRCRRAIIIVAKLSLEDQLHQERRPKEGRSSVTSWPEFSLMMIMEPSSWPKRLKPNMPLNFNDILSTINGIITDKSRNFNTYMHDTPL